MTEVIDLRTERQIRRQEAAMLEADSIEIAANDEDRAEQYGPVLMVRVRLLGRISSRECPGK